MEVVGLTITIAAAGTPQKLNATPLIVWGLTIQSDPDNVGTYILPKDKNGNNLAKLTKGQSYTPPQPYPAIMNQIDLSKIQVDASSSNDKAIVSYSY